MSQVTTIKTEILEDYALSPNPAFDKINNETVTLLENCPVSKTFKSSSYRVGGGNNMSFSLLATKTNFIDTGFELKLTVPVEIELANVPSGPGIDAYEACNYFKDVAISEYGLISVMDILQLKLNGQVVTAVNDVYKRMLGTGQYYDADEMLKKLPYSMPDVYSDFSHYGSQTPIKTVGLGGARTVFEPSQYYPLNIFTASVSSEYNSRRPYIELISDTMTPGQTIFKGKIVLTSYVPFSIFNLPSSDAFSLYGVNELFISINLRENWVRHLFCLKDRSIVSDVRLDDVNSGSCNAELLLNELSAPSYIRDSITKNDNVLPYRFNYTDIQTTPVDTKYIQGGSVQEFNSGQISVGSIPTRMYVFARGLKNKGDPLLASNYYGRIESIDVTIGTSTTSITDPSQIYSIAVANGCNRLRDAALYTNGYVLCLDLTKDLGIGTNAVIGSNKSTTIQIKMKVRDLCGESNVSYEYEANFLLVFNNQLVYRDTKFNVQNSIVLYTHEAEIDSITHELYDKHKFTRNKMIIGGSFWGTVFKGLKNAGKYIISNPGKVANFIGNAAKTLSGGQATNIIGGSLQVRGSDSSVVRATRMGGGKAAQNIFK